MPEQRNPIIRTEVFTVANVTTNQYDDLIIKTTEGKDYKISKKRERLFPVFQVGAEVSVGFSSYMNKEYIAEAQQTGTHVATTEVGKEAVKQGAKPIVKEDTRDRSVALSYAKDLVVAGKIELGQFKAYADKFLSYILNRE